MGALRSGTSFRSNGLEVHNIVSDPLDQNCYIAISTKTRAAVVIDPGGCANEIMGVLEKNGANPAAILLTHGHFDHIAGAAHIQDRTKAPLYVHRNDKLLLHSANTYALLVKTPFPFVRIPTVDHLIECDTVLRFSGLSVNVVCLPGHTQGGVGYQIAGVFFVGDTILPKKIGRTDLPGGDAGALERSVLRVLELCTPETMVCPGHGKMMTFEKLLHLNRRVKAMRCKRSGDA